TAILLRLYRQPCSSRATPSRLPWRRPPPPHCATDGAAPHSRRPLSSSPRRSWRPTTTPLIVRLRSPVHAPQGWSAAIPPTRPAPPHKQKKRTRSEKTCPPPTNGGKPPQTKKPPEIFQVWAGASNGPGRGPPPAPPPATMANSGSVSPSAMSGADQP